jgi:delta 1-pyrroline-5-carboxylate dehydrogenase
VSGWFVPKEEAMAAKSHKMFIDGKWVDATGGDTFEDMSPYTGEVYANVPAGSREDVRRAIEAAQAAFPEWEATPPGAKRRIFLEAAAGLSPFPSPTATPRSSSLRRRLR